MAHGLACFEGLGSRGHRAEREADDALAVVAAKHGITVNGSVPASQLRRLGSAPLNDAPFLAILTLTQDAGLSAIEVGDLIKRVRAAGSDEQAMATIEADREERREQIKEFRASGKSRTPVAAQLRQRLGFVLNHEHNPRELVEVNPTLAESHGRILDRVIAVLTTARELQGQV